MQKIPSAILAVLLLCAAAAAQDGRATADAKPLMTLTGVVYDPNGAVIAHAVRVVAHGRGGERYESGTDDEGFYKFSLPLGVYEIEVGGANGFCPTRVTNFRVVEATHGKMSLDFVLEPAATHTRCKHTMKIERGRDAGKTRDKIVVN